MNKGRLSRWVGFSLALVATLFCFLGYAEATWLSATPNYPHERAVKGAILWGIGTLIGIVLVIGFAVSLFKSYKANR